MTRADLLTSGLNSKAITRAVRDGDLIRMRRDRYAVAGAPADIEQAVRVGGRLTCVSALATTGCFVMKDRLLHVHVDRAMSRLRSPVNRMRRWSGQDRRRAHLHWGALTTATAALDVVDLTDAVRDFIRCQPPRHVIATLDSLLRLHIVSWVLLNQVFEMLPARYGVIRRLIDERCESGPESLVRLMLRQLGAEFEIQVKVEGVGRVDFLVRHFLIIECDSKEFHSEWKDQRRDRRRDAAAARMGLLTLRLLAEDIMYRPEMVRATLAAVLRAHSTCQN